MNGYGLIEKIYRPLRIGIVKSSDGATIIFTAGAVKRGNDGFQDLTEKDEVHYRIFDEKIGDLSIARDIWKK